ncbi:transcriptional regulator [Saccharothrix sp. ALI-22-I]|uniref:helix-turn-helix domain-containing protein n=1 Tax=Saccharothrix sp. ALI-22-I TaxID=1933778 RepID=UPI00097C4F84|nr:helix-turn-helix transcriptional regulator [Saccharothrix sp. ALI-22-I]ONI87340.1 transcriptional regulator [Saccharothrix sp. ALI-22-I]
MDSETTIGDRIRRFRGRQMTQQDLATRAGVSVDVIRKLEQNRRGTSIGTLHKIARALDVDTSLLLAKGASVPSGEANAGVVAIRHALTSVDDLLGDIGGEALPLDEAKRTVEYAWGAYWGGKYELLASILPTALPQVRATVHAASSAESSPANDLMARLYWVTGCTLVHMGQPDPAYLAIRMALTASQGADDPLLNATLRGSVAWQLLVQGRYDESIRVSTSTAASIEPSGDVPPEHLSAFGSLLITAATAAGRARRVAEARDLIRSAGGVAERIGHDRDDYETAFGPSQVIMQTVDVHVVTENYADALDVAKKMPRDAGLPLASSARHLADRAYALARLGHDQKALDTLLTMERMAPDWVRYQTLPKLVVGELVENHKRRVNASSLFGLARRLGVPSIT